MTLVDIVTLCANIALTLTFVVGLFFGIAQVKAVERDRKERLTLEALRNFQTREFAQLINFLNSDEFPKSEEEFDSLPDAKVTMYIEYAQRMEALGIQVAENIIDLDMVDKTLGSYVATTWKRYGPIFSKIRDRDPYIGEYFQWLAERVTERLEKNPRKPFYINQSDKK